MLDLLVVNPAAAHGIYGPLGSSLIAVEPPQWCRIIAGWARDAGFSVEILDAEALGYEALQAAHAANIRRARLVCVAVYGHQPSASTQQMWGAGEFCRDFKAVSDAPVIMVGGHPSALPERTLREEAIDYVGVGEGVVTVEALLRQPILGPGPVISNIGDIPGLAFRFRDEVRRNKPAPLVEDMARFHGNVWDLLPMQFYRAHNWQCFGDLSRRQPYASIFTSLGCPYKCEFCCINAPFDSNRYRMRRPNDVVNEIAGLHLNSGVRTFKITDEMFVLNERHYTAICEQLAATGLGSDINVWAYARVDTVKPENLAVLRRGGIRWLALGIESGSEHVRDGANKKMKPRDIVGTVKAIQDAGINVIGNFMFGLRDDDVVTMNQTLDLALDCMPDFANFYSTMAYPGSALYGQALEKGWTLPDSWRGYSQHNDDCRPLDTEHVAGQGVLAFRDAAFNRFFGDARYLSHVERKFGAETRAHVEQMTTYKLRRKLTEAA
jgi:anaerobic magnesium-protoporphyrin IX monomethyl ester cyclase